MTPNEYRELIDHLDNHSHQIYRGDPERMDEALRRAATLPDLLEACKELLEYVEAERGWKGEADAEPMVMRGRAAIAKAEGAP